MVLCGILSVSRLLGAGGTLPIYSKVFGWLSLNLLNLLYHYIGILSSTCQVVLLICQALVKLVVIRAINSIKMQISTSIVEQARIINEKRELGIVKSNAEILKEEIRIAARNRAQEIVEGLEEASMDALKRVTDLIKSSDQNVATKNAHFVINHVIGMPTQKSISTVRVQNIDVLAD